jgi:hypothetical protein
MTKGKIGIFNPEDRQSIIDTARRLKVDPYEFAAVLSLESGPNINPNIWGGKNNNHYSVIQFGGPEREKYLDSSKIGKYTRAELLKQGGPVEQFLLDRGFKPGQMGIDRLYSTILAGNPNGLNSPDGYGTTAAGSISRFKKGGDLHSNALRVLGDIGTSSSVSPAKTGSVGLQPALQTPGFQSPVVVNVINGKIDPKNREMLAMLGINSDSTVLGTQNESKDSPWANPFQNTLFSNNSIVDGFVRNYMKNLESIVNQNAA